jgi:hypothetical protein
MTSAMVRNLAVATLSVTAALFSSTVEAAPNSGSPFAGKYTGPVPDASSWGDWGSISISTGGGIVFTQPPAGVDGWKFSGSVQDDGTFSVTGKITFHGGWFDDVLPAPAGTSGSTERRLEDVAAKTGIETTLTIQSTGTIVRGADGNLSGTTAAGNSFVWTHK